ncbi:MAG: TMEM175 family protein, partial [Methanoregulaceae archaeon]|nr:TMEM175 family protein [Methanoregulaceae archaeon]
MTVEAKDSAGTCEDPGPCTGCKGVVPQDMFEILMNGVFAFVMTLIVKNNIPLPSAYQTEDFTFIKNYWDQVSSESTNFIFTFGILAVFYILFFEMMRNIRALDRFFVYISFGFILTIIFIPLSSLLWTFSDMPMPYGVLFHVNIICCGLLLYILWRHVSLNPKLIFPETSSEKIRNISLRILLFPITGIAGLFID